MDGGICLACVLIGHEFSKGSKIKLLRTDPARSSPSAVSDFERNVEERRDKKDSHRHIALHKDTSSLLYSVQEKIEGHLEDVDEILDGQFKFEVSEDRKLLRSITLPSTIFGDLGLRLDFR